MKQAISFCFVSKISFILVTPLQQYVLKQSNLDFVSVLIKNVFRMLLQLDNFFTFQLLIL